MIGWASNHGDKDTIPLVNEAISQLRGSIGVKKIALAGFCWGARYAVLLCGEEELRVDVASLFHPSAVKVQEYEPIKVPTIFHLAENDRYYPTEMITQTREVMAKKEKCQVFEYPATGHGFSLRGNKEIPEVLKARDESHTTTIAFFKSILLA
ncbi:hypothetical protein HK096_010435 [Nowakowskiella sp. JEL0078]|nr:hypothetical protein HK096_010435 [Nowakowskiella sp. JEL0078]